MVAACAVIAGCAPSTGQEDAGPSSSSPATQSIGSSAETACDQGVGHDAPEAEAVRVLNDVAFSRLQESADPAQVGQTGLPGLRYFAKIAVSVRRGAQVAILVPPEHDEALALDWASVAAGPVSKVTFLPCASGKDQEWTTYPGGFYADETGCVTVVVEVDGRAVEQEVPLGERCPR